MKRTIKPRTLLILYLSIMIIGFTFIILYTNYIIFVNNVEHGFIIARLSYPNDNRYEILIDGKKYEFNTKDKLLNLASGVANFKYRGNTIVKFLGYVTPIHEKLMSKTEQSIELEYSGTIPFSNSLCIYKISGDKIEVKDTNSIIIGFDNANIYKTTDGTVKTVIINGNPEIDHIRVGIKNQDFQTLDHDSIEFISDVPLNIEDKKDKKIMSIPSKSQITITPDSNGIAISCNGTTNVMKNRIYITTQDNQLYIKILSFKRGYGLPVYRGFFEITNKSNKLRIINEVSLENYLYQVVPSEMPASFGMEALKSQAIVARTYAVSEILSGSYAPYSFHVDDSTLSQVYNNISENPLASKAINETKGLVMKYDGEIVDARYYSTSHGYGANAHEIWSSNGEFPGKPIPYLTATSYLLDGAEFDLSSEENAYKFFKDWKLKSYDSNSPYFRWKVDFTKDELKNTIEKNLANVYSQQKNYVLTLVDGKYENRDIPQNPVGDLLDLKVTRRGAGGNIMELVIIGTNGTYKIFKELNVRYVLRPRKSDTGFDRDIVIKRIKSDDIKNASLLPSAFMVFDINRNSSGNINEVVFYGGGYGHSVGMSQYGAGYLSSKGYSFDKILKTYYKDVTLEKIY